MHPRILLTAALLPLLPAPAFSQAQAGLAGLDLRLACTVTRQCRDTECTEATDSFELHLQESDARMIVGGETVGAFDTVEIVTTGRTRGMVTMTRHSALDGGVMMTMHPQGNFAVSEHALHASASRGLDVWTSFGTCVEAAS